MQDLEETGSVCVTWPESNRPLLPPFFFFSLLFLPVTTGRDISRRKLGFKVVFTCISDIMTIH